MRLLWTPRARRAHASAIACIAENNPIAALEQLDEIERQIDLLQANPELGRNGRVEGTRELVIVRTSFIAVYRLRPRARRIEVIHFLHGAQQWPAGGR
jgi:toxin ParE1/3/4